MSMFSILGISSSAMNAQMVRMNASASNLANSSVVATTEAMAYKARKPIFQTVYEQANNSDIYRAGVTVGGMHQSKKTNLKQFDESNPLADKDGFVYQSNVNSVEEMIEMTAASRAYQTNVEIIKTSKKLILGTLRLGQ